MAELAEEYPEVIFLHCSGNLSNDVNFANYFGRIWEARYLAGIAAGLRTENNHLGYVAAMQIPECIYSMNAYFLGARSVNPDVTMDVLFTNTWYDPTIEGSGRSVPDRHGLRRHRPASGHHHGPWPPLRKPASGPAATTAT